MKWYQVTKRINGRLYLYWQRTKRVGKSVRTVNRYIGPAQACTYPISTTTMYRGGGKGAMLKGLSAQDIINYEAAELGNAIATEPGVDIPDIKSDTLIWLAASKSAAKAYGAV